MVDFTTFPPTYYTNSVPNNYTTQAVANGRYCNACTINEQGVSEFFITGNSNTVYSTSPTVYSIMLTWDQICGTTQNQEDFLEDNCNSSSNDLALQSLNT